LERQDGKGGIVVSDNVEITIDAEAIFEVSDKSSRP
jgi:hypothetical protein